MSQAEERRLPIAGSPQVLAGPQTRIPVEGEARQSSSASRLDAGIPEAEPREPWMESDRPPVPLWITLLFLAAVAIVGVLIALFVGF